MYRILITGGTGFLGSNLVKYLVSKRYNITLLKRSFSNTHRISEIVDKLHMIDIDRVSIDEIAKTRKFDIILHCATNYGKMDNTPLTVIEANLQLPLKLLTLAKEMQVKFFINTDTILDKRVSYYSLSKKQFREWMYFYASNLVCVNISLEHFFGPNDNPDKFVSFIIRNLINDVDSISLTEGNQKRDFIFISDVVKAFVRIIDNIMSFPHGVFHYEIGSGNLISIKSFVLLIKELIGNTKTTLNFGALAYREHEIMESEVDLKSIKKLGWTCERNLREGLIETIKFEKDRK